MVRHVSAIAVELAEALGDRALVDGHGYPYQVVPAERGGTDGAGSASDR